MSGKKIFVTEPFLPPLAEFTPYLEEIWASGHLTNSGPMHRRLEEALTEYLQVPAVSLFSNGTLALITALQSLEIKGEVITTPYSFVATAHSILWNNLIPVFVDIDRVTLNLNPEKVEAAITRDTVAILPVHCYGIPCDTASIGAIAARHGLKVIYDAAHAFGVNDEGGSVLRHGDLSIVSFHATKVFNTFEGGAIICPDMSTKRKIDSLKNFGITDETNVQSVGMNAKMSEVNAAFGLLQLNYLGEVLDRRKTVDSVYREILKDVPGMTCLPTHQTVRSNYSYFPVLVGPEYPVRRDDLYEKLKREGVFARRYFYPLISSFPMYSNLASADAGNLPVANEAARRVLCLPIFPGLELSDIQRVTDIIRTAAELPGCR